MTTPASKALERFPAAGSSPGEACRYLNENQTTIIEALRIYAAVEKGKAVSDAIPPNTDFARGYDACLEHLKKIGGGE